MACIVCFLNSVQHLKPQILCRQHRRQRLEASHTLMQLAAGCTNCHEKFDVRIVHQKCVFNKCKIIKHCITYIVHSYIIHLHPFFKNDRHVDSTMELLKYSHMAAESKSDIFWATGLPNSTFSCGHETFTRSSRWDVVSLILGNC